MQQFIVLSVSILNFVNAKSGESYTEKLYIKDLGNGFLNFNFDFVTTVEYNEGQRGDYHTRFFPLSILELVERYSVHELHMTLVKGFWDSDMFGFPLVNSPPEAEVWAVFSTSVDDVDEAWAGLTNVLSGHFCASLNMINGAKSTAAPVWSFRAEGAAYAAQTGAESSAHAATNASAGLTRYARLSTETVCTENLTPWSKLLPCKKAAGLAALLNPLRLFNARYHALGLGVRRVCLHGNCGRTGLQLTHTLSVVFDRVILNHAKPSWSLRSLLDRVLLGTCPLAASSTVFVDVLEEGEGEGESGGALTVPSTSDWGYVGEAGAKRRVHAYDVGEAVRKAGGALNVGVNYAVNYITFGQPLRPSISVDKSLSGVDFHSATAVTDITTRHSEKYTTVLYLETVPWFMRVQFRTLKILVNGRPVEPARLHYKPGRDRERPHHLELLLRLPPGAVCRVSYGFTKALQHRAEFPPDPHRGFYLPASVVTLVEPDWHANLRQRVLGTGSAPTSPGGVLRLYSPSLMVQMPTPDFTMPYNVICFVSTLLAIAFGSLMNLTTVTVVAVDPRATWRQRLVARIRNLRRQPTTDPSAANPGDATTVDAAGDAAPSGMKE